MGITTILGAVCMLVAFLAAVYWGFEFTRWLSMKLWGFGLRVWFKKKKPRTAIQTISGVMFDVMDPNPDTVRITDIAHALSNSCRYNGHVRRFYSVAEHCCHLCDYVLDMSDGMAIENAMHALMHDAAEAYLGDMPSPIKQVMTKFTEVEYEVELAIEKALGVRVSKVGYPWLDQIDSGILADEMLALMPAVLVDYDAIGADIQGWSPEQAKAEFLNRYSDLVRIMDGATEYNQEADDGV